MKNPIKKQQIGFTQVTNQILNDPYLSWKAKGLYAYIYSKPDGWDFSVRRIAKEAKDGIESTSSGLHELEKAGFIFRQRHRSGRVTYHVLIEPCVTRGKYVKKRLIRVSPLGQDSAYENPHEGRTDSVSNKDGEEINILSNSRQQRELADDITLMRTETVKSLRWR